MRNVNNRNCIIIFILSPSGILGFTFLKSPLILRQCFQIFTAVLGAHNFVVNMPPFTTWTILAILVLWDLFAVLAPCGPLRLMFKLLTNMNTKEEAKMASNNNKNDATLEIPAERKGINWIRIMVYSTADDIEESLSERLSQKVGLRA